MNVNKLANVYGLMKYVYQLHVMHIQHKLSVKVIPNVCGRITVVIISHHAQLYMETINKNV